MQNDIRKSWNNALALPVINLKVIWVKLRILKSKKPTASMIRWPNLSSQNWHRAFVNVSSLGPCWYSRLDTWHFLTSSMDLLIHTKHNLLISDDLDQIWCWKNIPITFSQGCTSHVAANISCRDNIHKGMNVQKMKPIPPDGAVHLPKTQKVRCALYLQNLLLLSMY